MTEINWIEFFSRPIGAEIGSRLGISYLQASLKEIDIKVLDYHFQMCQCEMGIMAISGVVWDAGMLLVDYLSANSNTITLGSVLDLGCGTGICGLAAYACGANHLTLSDANITDTEFPIG